jgi:hypothetical protein
MLNLAANERRGVIRKVSQCLPSFLTFNFGGSRVPGIRDKLLKDNVIGGKC